VSALGHYLEEEGLATIAISLIRPQTENTRPPRALWVPFELGRPFGPPNDPAFQKQVILAALGMLELADGPVALEDFALDDPREPPDPDWRAPIPMAAALGDPAAIADALESEIEQLDGAYRRSAAARGRTTVGLSRLAMAEIGRYVAAWLRRENPAGPHADMSAPLTLRFAVDDLKAYCLEAALDGMTKPSSRQLADWLWNETAAGSAIFTLRRAYREADDDRLKLIAGNFLVSGLRVPPGG
jgi:hypothetical protein